MNKYFHNYEFIENNGITSKLKFADFASTQFSHSLSLSYNIFSSPFFIECGGLYFYNFSNSMTGDKTDYLDSQIIYKTDLSTVSFANFNSWGYKLGIGYDKKIGDWNFVTELQYFHEFPNSPGLDTNFKILNNDFLISIGLGHNFYLTKKKRICVY